MSNNPYSSPTVETPPSIDQRNRLLPPAVSLIVVSVLWIVFALYGIVYFVGFINEPDTDSQTRRIYMMSIGWIIISILYCLILITGAFSMVRRGSYLWAVTTSCLAMIPLIGPCYFLGVPIGIWAFLVLRQPGVREAFRCV